MEFLRKLGQQLRDLWVGMSPARRLGVVLVLGLFAAVIALGYTFYQPQYGTLYSRLPPDEAQKIEDKLKSMGVPTKTAEDGTTILVPADRVGSLRVELAGQGLPSQMQGYELFDQPSFGKTPFEQNVNLLRAKQAELARSIQQLDPVLRARVEIAKAEPSPFVRPEKPTTASVLIQLKPGATLTKAQVQGIIAFVSKAVEGLTPENVTVVDNKGNLLSEPGEPEAFLTGGELERKLGFETYLSSRAESFLTAVLGPGRAVVRVTADLNFQKKKEKRETYNPDLKAVRTEKTESRTETTVGGGARGIPGAQSNLSGRLPAAAAAAGTAGTSTKRDEVTETAYEVSKVTQEVEEKAGAVERLTVAATVDLSPGEGAGGQPVLPKAEVEKLIKQAVGFREERDAIQVSVAKLPGPPTPPEPPGPEEAKMPPIELVLNIVRYGAPGLAALLLVILGWLVLRPRRREPVRPAAPPPVEPERMRERLAAAVRRDPDAVARALAALMEQQ